MHLDINLGKLHVVPQIPNYAFGGDLLLSSVSAFLNSSMRSRGSGIYDLLCFLLNSADTFKSVNSTILTKTLSSPAVFSRDAQSPYGPGRKMSAVDRHYLKVIHVPQEKMHASLMR